MLFEVVFKTFFQRFIRWHYKLTGAGSLYCCSGIPDKSTKETQKDWSKLLSDISNSLNEGEICENRFDIQINYDIVFSIYISCIMLLHSRRYLYYYCKIAVCGLMINF